MGYAPEPWARVPLWALTGIPSYLQGWARYVSTQLDDGLSALGIQVHLYHGAVYSGDDAQSLTSRTHCKGSRRKEKSLLTEAAWKAISWK
jgi:hypothetical protein